ncbi:MAG TPA: hypothetical protein DCP92_14700 [Nitrospiraceae bacterium]|nr:hypothetical protein [Nitrospiraceae bacterium]
MLHRTINREAASFIVVGIFFVLLGILIFAREFGHLLSVVIQKMQFYLKQYDRSFLLSQVDMCIKKQRRKRLINLLK